jgi:hypothetical protein
LGVFFFNNTNQNHSGVNGNRPPPCLRSTLAYIMP